jgi:hypothetical protein
MLLETLNKKIDELEKNHDKLKSKLMIEYCDANNPYKIGDKFTDHIGTILIERIQYSLSINPSCVYYGLELKKDGTPKKNGSKRQAWQSNEKK